MADSVRFMVFGVGFIVRLRPHNPLPLIIQVRQYDKNAPHHFHYTYPSFTNGKYYGGICVKGRGEIVREDFCTDKAAKW